MTLVRDQQWLESRLHQVWQRGFPDMMAPNEVLIRYGRAARTRLGSIRMSPDKKVSKILLNRLFQHSEIPLEVIDLTIAHELVHYLHGFSSPFEQKFYSPHAGGVVDRELKERGFSRELTFQKRWTKTHWPHVLRAHALSTSTSRVLRPRRLVRRRPKSLFRHSKSLIRQLLKYF